MCVSERERESDSIHDFVCTHCNTMLHTATYLQQTCRKTQRSTLQHTATPCNTPQHTAIYCNTLHYIATHRNTLQHSAPRSNTPQRTATHCNTLQDTATHCTTLQHAATHTLTLSAMPPGARADFAHNSAWDAAIRAAGAGGPYRAPQFAPILCPSSPGGASAGSKLFPEIEIWCDLSREEPHTWMLYGTRI